MCRFDAIRDAGLFCRPVFCLTIVYRKSKRTTSFFYLRVFFSLL